MLSDKIVAALNEQINYEFYSSYVYFGMAAYCDSKSLDGFASWFKIQAQEEVTHGMKIYQYLMDLGAKVELKKIAAPSTEFNSFEELFQKAVENEKNLAKVLNGIANLALEEKDQMTYQFLKWFLDEQVEEIALTTSVLDKIKLVGDNGNGIFILNEELGRRKPEAAAE